MMISLDAIETRVLGCLLEKERTTPDAYPLTFNSLLSACNQKTNRFPVMVLDADALGEACRSLASKGLVMARGGAGSRVTKYAHRIPQMLNLEQPQQALLGLLFVRGAQTLNELKTRSVRLCDFSDADDVELTLEMMMDGDAPLVAKLPKETGQREARYIHTYLPKEEQLSQRTTTDAKLGAKPTDPVIVKSASAERLDELETMVMALQQQVQALQDQLQA